MGSLMMGEKKKDESQLSKLTKDAVKTTMEQAHGLMSQVMKDVLFNLEKKDLGKWEHAYVWVESTHDLFGGVVTNL